MEEISVVVCLELHASWVNDERTGSYTALYYTSGALKQLSVTHIHISINPLESNLGLVSRPRMFGMETGAHRDRSTQGSNHRYSDEVQTVTRKLVGQLKMGGACY